MLILVITREERIYGTFLIIRRPPPRIRGYAAKMAHNGAVYKYKLC
jgi:hypothetical protein